MLLNSIPLRSLYRIGCLMVISAGLAAADTLHDAFFFAQGVSWAVAGDAVG